MVFKNLNETVFLAEVSSNHNGDLDRCKKIIDAVADAGCHGIKFQLFKVSELFSHEAIAFKPEIKDRVKWELDPELIPLLSDYSHKKGLLFSCTPFYLEAVDILKPYVDFYKIASYELLWDDLFKKCGETGLPVVFSTGMSKEFEIQNALNILNNSKCEEIIMLHCNSSYPTPIKDVNLNVIETFRNKFLPNVKYLDFGWSDHTVKDSVVLSSVLNYNSKLVEFHIDLEGDGYEFESGHCWLPSQISSIINCLKEIKLSKGNGKITPSESEIIERKWRADPSDGLRPLIKTRKIIK